MMGFFLLSVFSKQLDEFSDLPSSLVAESAIDGVKKCFLRFSPERGITVVC